ncbi:MAG: ATP-binding protein, partial [Planctomycetes bacterium]|nr:ATP-binding protein [Planctomycetota bacterium]
YGNELLWKVVSLIAGTKKSVAIYEVGSELLCRFAEHRLYSNRRIINEVSYVSGSHSTGVLFDFFCVHNRIRAISNDDWGRTPVCDLAIVYLPEMQVDVTRQHREQFRRDLFFKSDITIIIGTGADINRHREVHPCYENVDSILRFTNSRRGNRSDIYCILCINRRPEVRDLVNVFDCSVLGNSSAWNSEICKALAILISLIGPVGDIGHKICQDSTALGIDENDLVNATSLSKKIHRQSNDKPNTMVWNVPRIEVIELIEKRKLTTLFVKSPMDLDSVFQTGVDTSYLLDLVTINKKNHLVCYIIGDNGSGKSFLLRDVMEHYVDNNKRTVCMSSVLPDRMRKKSDWLVNLGSLSQDSSKKPIVDYCRDLSHTNARHLGGVLEEMGFFPNLYLIYRGKAQIYKGEGIIHDILSQGWPNDDQVIDEMTLFRDVSRHYEVGLRRSNSDVIVPYGSLSTGERSMASMAIKLLATLRTDDVLLLDEPENFLHVAWQRMIPKIINQISDAFNLITIIATHSPLLLLDGNNCGSLALRLRNRILEVIPPESLGSTSSLYYSGFNIITPGDNQVKEECSNIITSTIIAENASQGGWPQFGERLQILRTAIRRDKSRRKTDVDVDVSLVNDVENAIRTFYKTSANNDGK